MNLRTLAVLGAVFAVSVTAPTAQISIVPVDEVRPGMVGIGRTVFQGDTIEEFKVHILGVLRNVVGPRRNLILARLEGGPLEKTGVIAGMSGRLSDSRLAITAIFTTSAPVARIALTRASRSVGTASKT